MKTKRQVCEQCEVWLDSKGKNEGWYWLGVDGKIIWNANMVSVVCSQCPYELERIIATRSSKDKR